MFKSRENYPLRLIICLIENIFITVIFPTWTFRSVWLIISSYFKISRS
jgi:hypothetical protein